MIGVSFMLANYCARPTGWNMTGGWGQGDQATNEWFRPIETYGERLDAYLTDVEALGFAAVDFWTSLLNPPWATDARRIASARSAVDANVVSAASIRPGNRVVISCRTQLFPSGSLNRTNDAYVRRCGSGPLARTAGSKRL